jgi:hypothetical protein
MIKRLAVAIIVAIAVTAAFSFALSEKDVFDLQCSLTSTSGAERYSFHLKIPKYFGPRMVMLGRNTFDFKVVGKYACVGRVLENVYPL